MSCHRILVFYYYIYSSTHIRSERLNLNFMVKLNSYFSHRLLLWKRAVCKFWSWCSQLGETESNGIMKPFRKCNFPPNSCKILKREKCSKKTNLPKEAAALIQQFDRLAEVLASLFNMKCVFITNSFSSICARKTIVRVYLSFLRFASIVQIKMKMHFTSDYVAIK